MRLAWLGLLILLTVVVVTEASAQCPFSAGPVWITTAAPEATAVALGSLLELYRVPCDPVSSHMAVFLRIVPLSAPFPACEVRFQLGRVNSARGVPVFPDGAPCAWTEPVTILLQEKGCSLFKFGRCLIPSFFFPNRNEVHIQVPGPGGAEHWDQNVTLISLPALPPPPPTQPTMKTVSTGCETCLSGQVLNIFSVVGNPTGETIVAEYIAYGYVPSGDEFLIDWASGVVSLPPGDTALPLTGEYTIPAEIPRGVYFFGARLVHPASGRILAETFPPYHRIEKAD